MPHIARKRYALWAVAALAAFRAAVPLAALAASGRQLPGLPRYEYVGLTGDATGYYAAAREFMASWGRLPVLVVALLALGVLAGAVALAWAWRSRPGRRPWLVASAAAACSLVASVGVWKMHAPGAAVVGWPLVWSVPMLPYRAFGFPLDEGVAFGFGLVLSLAANVVTVCATALAGLYATGRRGVAVGAAGLVAVWPLLVGLIGGERAWENGTWTVDTGLAMYSEPVATALVMVALALLLSPRADVLRYSFAGAALGFATVVKLSNGVLAALALALLLMHAGVRRALPFAAAGAAFVPLVAVYWPKGYPAILDEDPNAWPDRPFSFRYVVSSWTDSLLFTPRTLLLLVPVAVIGAVALRGWPRRLLVLWALLNPVVYSVYWVTPEHPRFLFASLPAVFVLWVTGAAAIARRSRTASATSTRSRASTSQPTSPSATRSP
jgi:hypothetical protein